MKNIRMAGLWIFIFIFLFIFFWSLLPAPNVEKSFQVDFSQPIFRNQECQINTNFKNISFHTKYPAFLYYGKRALVEVLVKNELAIDSSSANDCMYAFEIQLDMGSVFIEPNGRLIQPVSDRNNQLFVFDIQPVDFERIKGGKLWIYLNSTKKDTVGVNRLPLFVIPIEIEFRSLLGIPLPWLRLVSLTAVFILLIVKVLCRRSG